MRALIIIPARAGSKGLPGKNTRLLGSKPLISHTIDFGLSIKGLGDSICVTSNDPDVLTIVKDYSPVSFINRPEYLASDEAGMNEVVLHALEYLEAGGDSFDVVLLLQPTSPFRNIMDYKYLYDLLDPETDIVVSVKESKANPYFTLFEEDPSGYLKKSKTGEFLTRQDCPKVYQYNGSMYLMRANALKEYGIHGINRIRKMVMPDSRSVDIDSIEDWMLAEFYLKDGKNENR